MPCQNSLKSKIHLSKGHEKKSVCEPSRSWLKLQNSFLNTAIWKLSRGCHTVTNNNRVTTLSVTKGSKYLWRLSCQMSSFAFTLLRPKARKPVGFCKQETVPESEEEPGEFSPSLLSVRICFPAPKDCGEKDRWSTLPAQKDLRTQLENRRETWGIRMQAGMCCVGKTKGSH